MRRRNNFFEKIKRTAEDLTTLEVNTIVKSEMQCSKPTDNDRLALYQLAGKYSEKLIALGEKYQKLAEQNELADEHKPERDHNYFRGEAVFESGGVFSFRELSSRARDAKKWILKHAGSLNINEEETEKDCMILGRIDTKCYEVRRVVETFVKNYHDKKSNIMGEQVFDEYKKIYDELILEGKKQREIYDHLCGSVNRFRMFFDEGPSTEELENVKAREETAIKENDGDIEPGMLAEKIGRFMKKWKQDKARADFLEKEGIVEYDFDLRDKMVIRKALDLGTEHVLMQTRISLDGDIITRLSEKFADAPKQFILDIHNTSIDISTSFWNKIYETLVSFGKLIVNKKL